MFRSRIERSRYRAIAAAVYVLSLPGDAFAEWGTGRWGEMVWGAASAPQIPAIPLWGQLALGWFLASAGWALLAKHKRSSFR